jgi:subtilisin family serine protease
MKFLKLLIIPLIMNHIVPIIVPISGSKIVLSREPVPNSIQLVNYKKKIISIVETDYIGMAIDIIEDDNLVEIPEKIIKKTNSKRTKRIKRRKNQVDWNLDILDGKLDNRYSYDGIGTGNNVMAYVVDSGITYNKKEFGDRIMNGISFHDNNNNNNTIDCNGHGTHVSSLLGGKTLGVAKSVKIVPVRIFGCKATTKVSTVIQALYWIIKQPKGIVNLSIIGPYNAILNTAVFDLISAGFIVIVAAGNNGRDACNYSPSSVKTAISVGCLEKGERVCEYSNEGSCVTLFSPGNNIRGLGINGVVYKSGTSMSAPETSGVAAILYEKYPGILQNKMKNMIKKLAANNTIKNVKMETSPLLSLRIF